MKIKLLRKIRKSYEVGTMKTGSGLVLYFAYCIKTNFKFPIHTKRKDAYSDFIYVVHDNFFPIDRYTKVS